MNILVINCGSSSLKYQLIDMDHESVLAKGLCERIAIDGSKLTHKAEGKEDYVIETPMKDHEVAVKLVIDMLADPEHGVIKSTDEIGAIGHRVLHGGMTYSDSVVVDETVKGFIKELIPLGPLHMPANLIGIEACEKTMPGVPQVAVFDTAFHQTMPSKAYMYALPYEYYEKKKIRKYGFHGTSHKYVTMAAAKMLGKPAEALRIITCHLGNGSSVSAVDHGKCVDTSMGFTPLDGTVMGTRTGCMDPAVVTYLMDEGLSSQEINTLMNKKSGVYGISGISSDFRDLIAAAEEGNERAQLAMDMFTYSVKKFIGAYAAAMGGVDVVVFTAGVGENNALTRHDICEGLEFLGIKIDQEANKSRGLKDITAQGAAVKTLVIPTNEELMIAIDTKRLVEGE